MIHKCNCLGNLHAYSSKSHWFQLGIFPDKYIELQPKPKKVKGLKGLSNAYFFLFHPKPGSPNPNQEQEVDHREPLSGPPPASDPRSSDLFDQQQPILCSHLENILRVWEAASLAGKIGLSSWLHALFLFFEDTSNLSPIIHLSSINMYLNFIFKTVFFWPLTPCQIFDAALWLKSLET